ncbi:MAG TPA: putative Ig domain-containing protein, partial [Verrucomicrobiae bacterium]|nr:putative Ig domain-containing protein [Verrucomicrobiae bacterium]
MKWKVSRPELRHDAQEGKIQMNTCRNTNELKQTRRSGSASGRQIHKLLLLGIVNLLVGINVWAQGAPPTTTTVSAMGIGANSAAVYGSVNPNGLATAVHFQYGTTTAYGSTTVSQQAGSGTTTVTLTASLSSLTASTTYHYRFVASNSLGTSYGADKTFTTTSASGGAPPTATTMVASGISSTSVTDNGTADPNGLATTTYFQWGTTTSYGNTTTSQSAGSGTTAVGVSASLGSLSPSTTYHYRLVASNSLGISYGADVSFTTSASGALPTATTAPASNISSTSATPNGSVNPNGLTTTVYFQFGTTTAYGSTTAPKSVGSGTIAIGVSDLFARLTSSTTYHYRLVASNSRGTSYGADVAFTTSAGGTTPTIATASPLPAATVGVAYSGTFTATGGTSPYVWSISAGSLPAGLTLSSGGVVSGTPTTATTASFTVKVTGANGLSSTKSFTLTVNPTGTTYTVATSANPSNGGTTSPNGSFSNGSTVTAQATIKTGYSFVNWTKNGAAVSTSPSYSFQLNGNVTLVANFTPVYTITATASPSSGGTISGLGNGLFISGSTVSLTANPSAGYSFKNWTENGSVVSSSATYSFTATANRTLVANFSATSTSGNYMWSLVHGGTSSDDGRAVAVDKRDGSVLLTGDFTGPVDFGGGGISGTSGSSVMLVKYAANGTYQWAKAPTGNGVSQGEAVAVDANGNVFVTGYFANSINFGAPSGSMTSAGWYDIFVVKYSPAGVCLWSKQFGSPNSGDNPGDEAGYSIAVDSAGNVIVGGSFDGIANFGVKSLTATGSKNGFVLKLAGTDGTPQWVNQVASSASSAVQGVAVDSANNVLITGWYGGTVNLGGG